MARNTQFAEQLLQRKKKGSSATGEDEEDEYQYYIYVLEANLSFRNGLVIPLLSEFLEYQLGDQQNSKQDQQMSLIIILDT